MSPAAKTIVLEVISHHAAQLRELASTSERLYRPDHPHVIELKRRAYEVQSALDELRAVPLTQSAAA